MPHIDIVAYIAAAIAFTLGMVKSRAIGYITGSVSWMICNWLSIKYAEILAYLWTKVKPSVSKPIRSLWGSFIAFELHIINTLSVWSMSSHWSFFWILYFIGWTLWRQLFPHPWYNDAMDLLVITWASAVVPFWIENSLKYSQGIQLKEQKTNTELLISLLNLNLEMGKKIFHTVEAVAEDIAEDDPKKQQTSGTE
jgi:hypothetical protein